MNLDLRAQRSTTTTPTLPIPTSTLTATSKLRWKYNIDPLAVCYVCCVLCATTHPESQKYGADAARAARRQWGCVGGSFASRNSPIAAAAAAAAAVALVVVALFVPTGLAPTGKAGVLPWMIAVLSERLQEVAPFPFFSGASQLRDAH